MNEKVTAKQPPKTESKHDKDRIILMAKLAVYDKHNGKADHKDDEFFRQDYIYSNNMRTRFYVFFGCVILTAFYFLHIASYQETDIFSINYLGEAIRVGIFFTAVLVSYTVIGTIMYTARYVQLQKRLEEYYGMLRKLEEGKTEEEEEVRGEKTNDDEDDDDGVRIEKIKQDDKDDDDDDFIDYLTPPRPKQQEEDEDEDEDESNDKTELNERA